VKDTVAAKPVQGFVNCSEVMMNSNVPLFICARRRPRLRKRYTMPGLGMPPSSPAMSTSSPESMRARIRELHNSVVTGMRERITSDVDTVDTTRAGLSGLSMLVVLPSITESSIEVHVNAATIPVDSMTEFTGRYPSRSRVVAVSIHGRHDRSGRPTTLSPNEMDAWATAMAPPGYEHYVVRLGVLDHSPARAVHYRYILGPDRALCVLDPHDHVALMGNHRYY
jgi:hypothetical protein